MRQFLSSNRRLSLILGILFFSSAWAEPNDPIVGEDFEALVDGVQREWQAQAEKLFPDSAGYVVLGPLPRAKQEQGEALPNFGAIRIICPNLESLRRAKEILTAAEDLMLDEVEEYLDSPESASLFRGVSACGWRDRELPYFAAVITTGQARFDIWSNGKSRPFSGSTREYSLALSDYLYSLDTGWMDAPAPRAAEYDLPDSLDFYAAPPDYVIEGYENYLNFLNSHDTIRTDFAAGLTEFVPSDSLWDAMKMNVPQVAYPNKEWPMLQHEYRKFFSRGGDVRVMNTLTRRGFDTLQAGEYFFAVSVTGKVRFGRELLRAEVERIEQETGKKVPRANHAFLFPGEPVLTAGAFFIETGENGPYITGINAQSGHYFYSNVSPTIREDISEHSDTYLLSLGHLFAALDSLGIPHHNVVISKL